jgi:hypothetical protein
VDCLLISFLIELKNVVVKLLVVFIFSGHTCYDMYDLNIDYISYVYQCKPLFFRNLRFLKLQ